MGLATAEQMYPDVAHDAEHVRLVTDLEHDAEARRQAARFIGACLSQREIDLSFAEEAVQVRPVESLYDAIQLAAEGDARARNMIAINVATDVVERTTKAGHITKVTLDVDEAGRIQQFGQSMESVQANSLRYASCSPQMLARTKAETTNSFRIAEYHHQGLLDDYNLVVFSRAADDMAADAMAEAGFFVDTMSVAIQVTTADGQTITTESAFVAGRRSPDDDRHDAQTITQVGRQLGVDIGNKSATELLATPLRIHKSVMPNGVIDIVKLYDDCAGGTFFGEAKPVQDYFAYRALCEQREARFQPLVETITDELIAEAADIDGRVHATARLHQLSQDRMVMQAAFDESINPAVFGPAAEDIIAARQYIELEDYTRAEAVMRHAQKVAVSSSCPAALRALNGRGEGDGAADGDATSNDDPGDCEFVSKECPKCHKKNVMTKISKGKISGSCGCSAKL